MQFIKTLSLFLLLLPAFAQAQIITTVAGNGTAGYSGDGGQATDACLFHPRHVVLDRHGNIYFSDMDNEVIRKVDTSGIIRTIAGTGTPGFSGDGGPATLAELFAPADIRLDNTGNLYICDFNNARIRKIDTAGIISTIAGTGTFGYNGDGIPATAANLNGVWGIAVDTSGQIYISDFYNYRVRRIDAAGIITTFAGVGTPGFSGDNGPATNAQVAPIGIAIDKYSNIYLGDTTGYIRKINPGGIITSVAGNGSTTYSGDGGPATAAGGLPEVEGIAVDDTGNLYIADEANNKIRKISASGNIKRIAGLGTTSYSGDGGDALLANLQTPTGLTITLDGRIYIADAGNNRVRCIGCSKDLGVNDIVIENDQNLTVTPNPSTGGQVTIQLHRAGTEPVQLNVVNMLGITVQVVTGCTNREIALGNDLQTGVYCVRAVTASGSVTGQLVVQR